MRANFTGNARLFKLVAVLRVMESITLIPLDQLFPSSANVRIHVPEEGVRKLAEDIAMRGLLHPLIVRPEGTGYGVVCGRMRLEAIRLLQRERPQDFANLFGRGVPCIVKELSDAEAIELSLGENLRQNTLTPEERGRGIARLHEMGLSEEEISKRIQIDLDEVRRFIRMYSRLREAVGSVAPSRAGRPPSRAPAPAERGVSRAGLVAVVAAAEKAARRGAIPQDTPDKLAKVVAELARKYSLSTSELQLLARRIAEKPQVAANEEELERAAREIAMHGFVETVVAIRRDLLDRVRDYARRKGVAVDEAFNELIEIALRVAAA
jgi:ParB family chromosome partitioning protein